MKKLRFGSVEILGYGGIAVWIAVILLRGYPQFGNEAYRFLLGILPNLGAAWAATMFGKWIVTLGLKRELTVRTYLVLCIGVFVLAFASELVHDMFLNSPFDPYDILVTVIAQLIIFVVPVLTHYKSFSTGGTS